MGSRGNNAGLAAAGTVTRRGRPAKVRESGLSEGIQAHHPGNHHNTGSHLLFIDDEYECGNEDESADEINSHTNGRHSLLASSVTHSSLSCDSAHLTLSPLHPIPGLTHTLQGSPSSPVTQANIQPVQDQPHLSKCLPHLSQKPTHITKDPTNTTQGSSYCSQGSSHAIQGGAHSAKDRTNPAQGISNPDQGLVHQVQGLVRLVQGPNSHIQGPNRPIQAPTQSTYEHNHHTKGNRHPIQRHTHPHPRQSHPDRGPTHHTEDPSHPSRSPVHQTMIPCHPPPSLSRSLSLPGSSHSLSNHHLQTVFSSQFDVQRSVTNISNQDFYSNYVSCHRGSHTSHTSRLSPYCRPILPRPDSASTHTHLPTTTNHTSVPNTTSYYNIPTAPSLTPSNTSLSSPTAGTASTASTASTGRTPPRPSPTSQLDRGATHLYLNPLPRQTAFHKEGSQEKDDSSLRTGSPWSQPTNGSFTIGPVGGASTNIQTHTVTVTPHTQRPAPVILDEDYDC